MFLLERKLLKAVNGHRHDLYLEGFTVITEYFTLTVTYFLHVALTLDLWQTVWLLIGLTMMKKKHIQFSHHEK